MLVKANLISYKTMPLKLELVKIKYFTTLYSNHVCVFYYLRRFISIFLNTSY